MQFEILRLRVLNVETVTKFYCNVLGMSVFAEGIGYSENGLKLHFEEGPKSTRTSTGKDGYWKIGIVVQDLVSVVKEVRQAGGEVSDPSQFKDIGYVCHLKDPSGMGIELLQQCFEGKNKENNSSIKNQATLAHITLRVADLDRYRKICENKLGMRLMSVQPVNEYNFTLYFYSWSTEDLPDPDTKSVANREWLWARPYALLELQHLERASTSDIRPTASGEPGPIAIICGDPSTSKKVSITENEFTF
eukprot:TRINITY_DN25717_c0_g1_i1.p1 TRINITY_DN25717_c0_g1~~TRINITY_DN25717_c0_g1_i1.p1  ORF type:complete len:248 (+),score=43.89 TRINITY_DN25717_c0_g1_i1:44-787(+)